jgi:iron(III) transport system permease protein
VARATSDEAPAAGRQRPLPLPTFVWLPALLVAAAVVLPVLYLVVRAAGADEGVLELLLRGRTLRVLINTTLLATAVTATSVVLAVPLAWLTTRTDLPGARLWSVLAALPLVVPSYIGGFMVVTVFGPVGTLQRVLEPLTGLSRLPDIYGFPGAWLTLTLFAYPYVLLSVRAGFRGLDPSLEDAARSLGEGEWTTFRRVTLPLLWPWIQAGALLVSLYVLSDFGAVSIMRFESFTNAIYLQYQAALNRSYAAVLSLVLVALAAGVLVLGEQRGRARFHRLGAGAKRPSRVVALGRWRTTAVLLCAVVAALGVAMPVGVLAYWLAIGVQQSDAVARVLVPAARSLYASALGAGLTLLMALPVAVLSVRYGGALARFTLRLTYVSYALPGLVIALALVFFAARYAPTVYQTLGLLVFAYAVHFLPQATGPLRSALQQVSPSQEEAARTLGRTAPDVLWSITLPLVRPGVVAAGALVFLTIMKELPATLLLSPTGFDTLATTIWSDANDGRFGRTGLPALVLLAVSSASMWLLLGQEGGRAS